MNNTKIFYKYIIKSQILLKYPKSKLIKHNLQKVIFNIYINTSNKYYYIYLYNICLLIRMLTNKILYVKKIKQNYGLDKLHFSLKLKGNSLWTFIETFNNFLLPVFLNYNMGLKKENFDKFGNFNYFLKYIDPIFTSKNIVTIWNNKNLLNIQLIFKKQKINIKKKLCIFAIFKNEMNIWNKVDNKVNLLQISSSVTCTILFLRRLLLPLLALEFSLFLCTLNLTDFFTYGVL